MYLLTTDYKEFPTGSKWEREYRQRIKAIVDRARAEEEAKKAGIPNTTVEINPEQQPQTPMPPRSKISPQKVLAILGAENPKIRCARRRTDDLPKK